MHNPTTAETIAAPPTHPTHTRLITQHKQNNTQANQHQSMLNAQSAPIKTPEYQTRTSALTNIPIFSIETRYNCQRTNPHLRSALRRDRRFTLPGWGFPRQPRAVEASGFRPRRQGPLSLRPVVDRVGQRREAAFMSGAGVSQTPFCKSPKENASRPTLPD